MSSSRAGGGAGSAAIPANARKTVQSLKEIVPNGEEEIYSVLKECNMDPDETVQRLLNQDPFHEVKRKRDKKKEWNKAGADSRLRPASGVTQGRGGRAGMSERGSGRGGGFSRHPVNDVAGGRGRSFSTKENGGVNTALRVSKTSAVPSSAVPPSGQKKPLISGVSSQPGPAATVSPSATVGPSAGLLNGIPSYIRSPSIPQGSWGAAASGHTTMADIVKSNGAPLPPSGLTGPPPVTNATAAPPVSTSASQQYIIAGTAPMPISSSGVYSASTDSVLDPSRDPRATGTSGATKREIGTVGNQRTKGEWSTSSPLTMDSLSAPSITSQSLQSAQTSASSPVAVAGPDRDTEAMRPSSPSASPLPPILQQDRPSSQPVADTSNSVGAQQPRHGTGSTSSGGLSVSRTPVGGGPFSRPVYLSQQHPVGTQKATGAGLEWKPKVVLQGPGIVGAANTPLSEAVTPSSPSSVAGDSGIVTAATKLKGLSIHEDQPVVVPDHVQVAEPEQTHLSFGSFGAGFGTSFSSTFVSEDSSKANISIAESTTVIETPTIESSSASSAVIAVPAALSQSYVHQSISTPEEVSVVSNEPSRVSLPPPAVLQSDAPKLDPVAPQGPHYPYLPAIPNYGGFNVMQQVPLSQYTYETSETQPPDTTRLPSLGPYTDPTPSFYTPLYRPGSDGDARYPFVTSNTSNKYNGNMGLVSLSGQNLPSQESGNAVVPPVPASQTSQSGNGQTGAPVPQQQPLPLHAYGGQPGGAPLGHHFANVFGYQYIQPSYAYMHSHPPYQHNYTTSSVYPQGPTGGSYPTAAASTYSPGGVTAVKYPLPQYKPGSATGMGPHSGAATGYGGYSSAQSGYAANPSVTVGSTTGYDDAGIQQQYKDNIYIPNQQVEGSTVWIQAQLSRDMALGGGMQTSSYYNIPTQGQHGTYPHAQQPSHAQHAHPGAYASLYHPSQSGQAPTAHQQLLQQAQGLGAGGGSQVGSYQQQPQRTQQTWANNY